MQRFAIWFCKKIKRYWRIAKPYSAIFALSCNLRGLSHGIAKYWFFTSYFWRNGESIMTPENDMGPRNMLLIKYPQFLANFFETWSKLLTHFDQVSKKLGKNCGFFDNNIFMGHMSILGPHTVNSCQDFRLFFPIFLKKRKLFSTKTKKLFRFLTFFQKLG